MHIDRAKFSRVVIKHLSDFYEQFFVTSIVCLFSVNLKYINVSLQKNIVNQDM
ncbi:MAG: hypothetical protein CLLPBCKN_007857 [Chroococcidiopsis cubana SAG 39.79]|uniref:Uncharacterized protein n=1 Tax=Chroococcidiopsis cubana SAG 39.79 TaxID=388085 RepID=A0AB37US45_9CYAN|nr:hypothetical protein [Chroococcidiopsis cubana SAG 39.79]RUT14224.1 hypothetical protein DSM107010_02550 [Chroococcidiopsis cubana SAG 39.79]